MPPPMAMLLSLASVLLALQLAACLAVAARSAAVERGGSRLVAAGLVAWCGVGLAGAVAALGW